MHRRLLTILFTLSALAAIAPNALASPITTTASLSFSVADTLATAGPDTATLVFDKFDPGLGTLMGVTVGIGSAGAPSMAALIAQFQAVGSPGTVNAELMSVTDGLPLIAPFSLSLAAINSSCVSCPAFFDDTSPLIITFAYDQTIVAPFIGSGTLPLTIGALVTGSAQNAALTGSWSGAVSVAYTYEPAPATTPVPEPASLLLLGSGMAAAGLSRRRAHQK